ncbi:MAG: sigma-54-dependent Fis family transcriptional regulator [Terracidiphilus sp.]
MKPAENRGKGSVVLYDNGRCGTDSYRQDHLARARALLGSSRAMEIPPELLRAEILDSWRRCIDWGLDPGQPPRQMRLSGQELRNLIERDAFLMRAAQSEMRRLQRQVPNDTFVLAFSNRDEILMDVVPMRPSINGVSEVTPGVCWKESLRGTNALGTAAFTRRPVCVNALEHFFPDYGGITCTTAPVTDPDGEVVGLLDVVCDWRSRWRHTLSLTSMSARHIEAALFRERFRSCLILQFHSREEFAHTLDAGLIAFDEQGRVLGCNRQARFFLDGLPIETGHSFDEVFRIPFHEFLFRSRKNGEWMQLVDIMGSSYSACVHSPGSRPPRFLSFTPPAARGAAETPAAGFVCRDPAVLRAVALVEQGVKMSVPILIRGETGTGKEMLAQYAHRASGRKGRFVAVNCAAVPEDLIQSELFGYSEGAFTGARSGGSRGLVMEADGGTLFLDEIGDLPLSLQPALLRFLDNWTIRPIGSGREQQVDVQLVAATNSDLEQAVAEKKFRLDLLHRIDAVDVFLPPLSQRSDFDEIVLDLLGRLSPRATIDEGALRMLKEHAWKGNIRELRNFLTRVLIGCAGAVLCAEAVESVLRAGLRDGPAPEPDPADCSRLADLHRQAVLDAYRKNDGNISRTAQALRVSRNTVYRELKRVGIKAG